MRRLLLALLLLLLCPAVVAAATLEVRIGGETPRPVDLATLPADVTDREYAGERVTGVALGTALKQGEAPAFSVQGVTVSAGTNLLTLGVAEAYPQEGQPRPPVLVTGEGGAVRLLLADGRAITAPDGRLIADVALKETERGARNESFPITISPRRPAPGQRVRLRVDDPQPGVTYGWRIDGRDAATGATVTHTFREAGRYPVEVFPRGAPGYGLASVVVGDPEPEDDDAAGTPAGAGGAGGGAAAGGSGAGAGSGSGSGGGGFDDFGGGSSGVAPAGVPPETSDIPAPAPTPAPSATPTPAPASSGTTVDGELLGDAVLVAQTVPAESLAQEATQQRDAAASLRIPTGAWVLGGTLLLGWFGWGLDNLRARPRWS